MSGFICKHCGSTREPIHAATSCPTGVVQLDQEDPQFAELNEFDPDGMILVGLQACRDCNRIESFWIEDASAPVRLDWGVAEFVGSAPGARE
jgi:hypothetical protein